MAIIEIKTDSELIGIGAKHADNVKAMNDNFAELNLGNADVTPAANIAALGEDATVEDVATTVNELIAALKTAGLMATAGG